MIRMEPSQFPDCASVSPALMCALLSRLREGQRDIFPARHHLQAAAQVGSEPRGPCLTLRSQEHRAYLFVIAVLPLYPPKPSSTAHRDRHLVPDWPRLRAAERRAFSFTLALESKADLLPATQFIAAKESYERVLAENPAHAKVLQQLGGLYHRSRAPFYNPETSVTILTKSLESGMSFVFPERS